jgi:hypothetical protein
MVDLVEDIVSTIEDTCSIVVVVPWLDTNFA